MLNPESIIRPVAQDDPGLLTLLAEHGLPIDDLEEGRFVKYQTTDGTGFGGLSIYGTHGLIRSLVASPSGQGIGAVLVTHLVQLAAGLGVRHLWLLTTSTEGYFSRHGFAAVSRVSAPAEIQACAQFAHLCPETAVLMRRDL